MRRALSLMLLAGVATTGCSALQKSYDKVGRREVVVRFKQPVDPAGPEAAAVREACPGGPHVVLEPASRSTLLSERYTPVRYDITGASDSEYGATLDCLAKQSAVYSTGIAVPS